MCSPTGGRNLGEDLRGGAAVLEMEIGLIEGRRLLDVTRGTLVDISCRTMHVRGDSLWLEMLFIAIDVFAYISPSRTSCSSMFARVDPYGRMHFPHLCFCLGGKQCVSFGLSVFDFRDGIFVLGIVTLGFLRNGELSTEVYCRRKHTISFFTFNQAKGQPVVNCQPPFTVHLTYRLPKTKRINKLKNIIS